ncbi:MAG: VOC family protein [Ghiorsea sp.]
MSHIRPVLHHVAMIVADLEKAAQLYGDILGLQLDQRPDLKFNGLFYKLGNGQQLHLMKLDNPDAASLTPEHGGRYRHLALGVTHLDVLKHKLEEHGFAYTSSKSGRAAIFFYDSDGNAVELLAVDVPQQP